MSGEIWVLGATGRSGRVIARRLARGEGRPGAHTRVAPSGEQLAVAAGGDFVDAAAAVAP